ncbi:hypothetical protein F5148DRAFT_359622 [Russula earlei]|uniref:Uncharacterized protein n=1 Tax=Russula earlei TaxID=71964 RepID=A0ACC0UIH7_9AGAM|nr:hypothetical protein F5148DRAFT_359622 [Russula earlei]
MMLKSRCHLSIRAPRSRRVSHARSTLSRHPNSSSPSKQNDVSTSASTDVHVNDQVERWSPSVPVPIALPVTTRLSDETSESANSVSVTEDGNPPVLVPERPWSPSVPAALSTQPSRRHNIKGQRAELLEDANSSSETQPSLRTKLPPSSTSSSPVPPTPPSPTKIRLPAKPRSSSFVPGSFVSDITNQPPFAFSDEDTKTNILPGKTSSSPPLQPSSGPLLPAEAPSSPPVAYPPSPNLRKDHLPSRLSPASSRGSFSHGPLESSATSVPSHPSSPKQSLKKPQTLSWPPFRPGRDDGSTDFYPPFRAGPETGEPLPPQNFRPTSGPATPHDHIPLNPQIRGRPAMISNPIPVAPRYSSVTLPSGPGRPSSPASQLSHNSQLFGPSMSPKPPLKLSHGIVPDIGQPPRQPRAEVAPPAMGSPPMSQGMTPRNFPHFHRYRKYFVSRN